MVNWEYQRKNHKILGFRIQLTNLFPCEWAIDPIESFQGFDFGLDTVGEHNERKKKRRGRVYRFDSVFLYRWSFFFFFFFFRCFKMDSEANPILKSLMSLFLTQFDLLLLFIQEFNFYKFIWSLTTTAGTEREFLYNKKSVKRVQVVVLADLQVSHSSSLTNN